ncbi:glycosyltransferase family 4 protein [Staphylococcus borealis]|uniref:glycosyltransferase family 4 protein n=1 Tax=Staphylococcus borealis TaxID=2742203 RepID=UPI00374F4E91
MKILHLNSNFLFSKLYENQINNMSDEFEQIVYNPLRKQVEYNGDIKVYSPVNLSRLDSFLSFKRRNKSLKYLERKLNIKDINLTHAHTMTNDGILALKIKKKYNTPYILTLRNTDINYSLRYKRHLKNVFLNVILESKIVVFPNHSYKDRLLKIYNNNKKLELKLLNALVIPNGIDKIWLNNSCSTKKKIDDTKINVLFIARIYPDKNLHNLLKAISRFNNIELTVVGSIIDQKYFDKINEKYSFTYLGSKSKSELIKIMKDYQIFAMPSFKETFGLVYIEALSQNLPIIHSKNEGVDKYFEDGQFGKSVTPNSVDSIIEALKYIIKNYNQLQNNLSDKSFLNEFDWQNIGEFYSDLYIGEVNE